MKSEGTAARVVIACPSEDEVLAFAAGRLSPERRAAAHLHFDYCDVCQELLNEAVHALAHAPTDGLHFERDVGWGRQFRPGTLVGQRYEIRRFIARGGMGEVYEAFDQELQGRVALKTVTATACDSPSAVRRLKAEVHLARLVSHPNVCRIYDFGTHAGSAAAPTCFLTMEFVDGETLGQHVRKTGALPVDDACALARALLFGLKAAHDAGVLHRDFKSDNVMLRESREGYRPVILDFGLARTFEQPAEQLSSRQHGVVGTFAYLAPEQLEGEPHSTASDIYSFGVVWFEMLTGELPFKSRSSPALTTLDRLTRAVPTPSSKNPAISEELDAIVLGCLRRLPSDRFTTVDQVLAALAAMQSGRKSRARAPLSLAAGLCAGVAVGLVAGTASFVLGSPAHPAPRNIVPGLAAMLPERTASVAATLRTNVTSRDEAAPLEKREATTRKSVPSRSGAKLPAKSSVAAPPIPSSAASASTASVPPSPSLLKPGWEDPF
ncbi:MAG TPA: serine/threonine-protein kinase [Polyangiaceae bacterium]|nr:serine/threonine-protein kinase [Polyangiaceae bacterium]